MTRPRRCRAACGCTGSAPRGPPSTSTSWTRARGRTSIRLRRSPARSARTTRRRCRTTGKSTCTTRAKCGSRFQQARTTTAAVRLSQARARRGRRTRTRSPRTAATGAPRAATRLWMARDASRSAMSGPVGWTRFWTTGRRCPSCARAPRRATSRGWTVTASTEASGRRAPSSRTTTNPWT